MSMDTGSTLLIKNLSKNYGKVQAVQNVSFQVEPGEIFALIGPNGAGKTTTIRIISTLLQPSSGEAYLQGIDIFKHPEKVRQLITYLPDEAGAYKSMSGIQYLDFMATLYASEQSPKKQMMERAREICQLGDRLGDKIGTYSRGMIRKLLLARAVMSQPKLAILDEPTSGLDVINALEIRKIIKELSQKGMSFLLSSHNMLEIEYLSDRVGIINKGRLLLTGKAEEIKARYGCQNLEEVFERVVSEHV